MEATNTGKSFHSLPSNAALINIKIYIPVLSIVAVVSVVTNGLFLFVLIKKRSLHCPSNTLLGLLCSVDLLTGLIALPLCIAGESKRNCFDCKPFVLQLASAFSWTFLGLSYQIITLISLDRYAAICHPFRYLQAVSSSFKLQDASLCFIQHLY